MSRALDVIVAGSTTGIGSLPHRNASQAVEFAFDAYDVPAIPSLPRRSPAESSIAQALVGATGVTLGQYGTVAVDVERLDPAAPVETDLRSDNFVGFRTFLDVARNRRYAGPVKWQFVGPISLGVALRRAGAAPDVAFGVAAKAVGSHLSVLSAAVSAALPDAPQLVVLDEPFIDGLMSNDFPIAPDEAVDLLSSAMAVLEPKVAVGVHCCGDADVATLLESGPSVLSLPVSVSLVPLAGYLDRFLRNGGWIAWGAVATEGPIGVTSARSWHHMSKVWCELVQRGLRRQPPARPVPAQPRMRARHPQCRRRRSAVPLTSGRVAFAAQRVGGCEVRAGRLSSRRSDRAIRLPSRLGLDLYTRIRCPR